MCLLSSAEPALMYSAYCYLILYSTTMDYTNWELRKAESAFDKTIIV